MLASATVCASRSKTRTHSLSRYVLPLVGPRPTIDFITRISSRVIAAAAPSARAGFVPSDSTPKD